MSGGGGFDKCEEACGQAASAAVCDRVATDANADEASTYTVLFERRNAKA